MMPIDRSTMPIIFVCSPGRVWELIRCGDREWRRLPGETQEEFEHRVSGEVGRGELLVVDAGQDSTEAPHISASCIATP